MPRNQMEFWSWTFTAPGAPVPQSRVTPALRDRRGRWHKPHYTEKSIKYRRRLALAFACQRPAEPVAFAVGCDITVSLPEARGRDGKLTPAGMRVYPTHARSGDCDNYAKQMLDALQDAGVLADDCWVCDLHVTKRWFDALDPDASPGVYVRLEAL